MNEDEQNDTKIVPYLAAEYIGTALNSEARTERVQWLVERLALRPVDRAALAGIPELK